MGFAQGGGNMEPVMVGVGAPTPGGVMNFGGGV